jgi:hypothetical protein
MQTKIFGAVVLGAALALAGCSGSNNGTSSTGTGSTGGSSTSSGSTTGNPTTTTTSSSGGGGACSNTNLQGTCANKGETCQRFTKKSGAHENVCACTPEVDDQNSGALITPSSCASNTDGKKICDDFTLTCRLPQSFENANLLADGGIDQTVGCDFNNNFLGLSFCNFGVTNGQCDPAPPDAGQNPGPISTTACVLLCQQSSDCTTATSCDLTQALFYLFPDGGDATLTDGGSQPGGTPIGFCNTNVCGAGAAVDGGVLNGDYFAACDAHGSGDGECLPLLTDGAGVCFVGNADAGDQGICDPSFQNQDVSNGCALGSFCFSTAGGATAPAPGETGECLPMCNADAPDSGIYDATCSSTFTRGCLAFGSDDPLVPGGGLSPGFCAP